MPDRAEQDLGHHHVTGSFETRKTIGGTDGSGPDQNPGHKAGMMFYQNFSPVMRSYMST